MASLKDQKKASNVKARSSKLVLQNPFQVATSLTPMPRSDRDKLCSLLQRCGDYCKSERQRLNAEATEDGDKSTSKRRRNAVSRGLCPTLVIGVNSVTRGLEKGELTAIVVCKDVNPSVLTSHLYVLAAMRKVPVAVCQDSSVQFGRCLGINMVLALGFKAASGPQCVDDLCAYVRSVSHLPLLPGVYNNITPASPDTISKMQRQAKKGQKDGEGVAGNGDGDVVMADVKGKEGQGASGKETTDAPAKPAELLKAEVVRVDTSRKKPLDPTKIPNNVKKKVKHPKTVPLTAKEKAEKRKKMNQKRSPVAFRSV